MRTYRRLHVRQSAGGAHAVSPPPGARQWFQSEESVFGTEPHYWTCPNKVTAGADYVRQQQPTPVVPPPGSPINGRNCLVLDPLGLSWLRQLSGPTQTIVGGLTVGIVGRVTAPPQNFSPWWCASDANFFDTGYGAVAPDATSPVLNVWVGTAGWDGRTYTAGIPWAPPVGDVIRGVLTYDPGTGAVTWEVNNSVVGAYNYVYNPANEPNSTIYLGASFLGCVGADFQTYIDYGAYLDSDQLARLREYLDWRAGV